MNKTFECHICNHHFPIGHMHTCRKEVDDKNIRETMHLNEYQELSKRTMPKVDSWEDRERVLGNFALGLVEEGGEVAGVIKKILHHGHSFEVDKIREELGDVLFYAAGLATLCGLQLEDVAQGNIDKLRTRYADGFSKAASIARVDTK